MLEWRKLLPPSLQFQDFFTAMGGHAPVAATWPPPCRDHCASGSVLCRTVPLHLRSTELLRSSVALQRAEAAQIPWLCRTGSLEIGQERRNKTTKEDKKRNSKVLGWCSGSTMICVDPVQVQTFAYRVLFDTEALREVLEMQCREQNSGPRNSVSRKHAA